MTCHNTTSSTHQAPIKMVHYITKLSSPTKPRGVRVSFGLLFGEVRYENHVSMLEPSITTVTVISHDVTLNVLSAQQNKTM